MRFAVAIEGAGVRVLKAAEGVILDLAFSPDGNAIAAAVEFQGVFLWNLGSHTPSPIRLANGTGSYQGGLQFSRNGRTVCWVADGARREFDRDGKTTSERSFVVTRLTIGVTQSQDGNRVASQHGFPDFCLTGWRAGDNDSDDEWIRTWNISTADVAVERPTFSPDGRLFAMLARSAVGDRWSSNPRRVEVRDGATSALLGTGDYPYSIDEPLQFSPDGQQLVGFNDMTLLVWPVPAPGPLGTPKLIRNDTRKQFTALAYHPSGRQLYAASNDEAVHVFDTTHWERVRRFSWGMGRLKSVAISPDGTLAGAGGDRGDVVIWDVDG